MKKFLVYLSMAVALCFVLASLAQATDTAAGRKWAKKNLKNKKRAASIPIWQITQDGKAASVSWVDHPPDPCFAIYDAGTPGDQTDDVVLHKETGLVWARVATPPDPCYWFNCIPLVYDYYIGGRKGWRVPTVEELASLVDPSNSPTLRPGHPFTVWPSGYWSSTTDPSDENMAFTVDFGSGSVSTGNKTTGVGFVWPVRGGYGHDG
jgi:hypothetical protein